MCDTATATDTATDGALRSRERKNVLRVVVPLLLLWAIAPEHKAESDAIRAARADADYAAAAARAAAGSGDE